MVMHTPRWGVLVAALDTGHNWGASTEHFGPLERLTMLLNWQHGHRFSARIQRTPTSEHEGSPSVGTRTATAGITFPAH